ncbi:hypothetical protein [Microbacterium sp. NPDC087589]|uniref:hypothetical protein n=1 Tax=Microbacterium sp. NPDC087589 TaxID=3364191 RepID=UPI003827F6FA
MTVDIAVDRTDSDRTDSDRTDSGAPTPNRRPRRRGGLLFASIVLVGLGASFLSASVLAPDFVDKVTGDAKVSVLKQFHQIFAPDELPTIRLGAEGGMVELDHCDGAFTEMVSYRIDDVLPLFAAHNNCGGDVILGWELGQRIMVEGSDVVYEVIEERHTPKWSNVEALAGMTGEFMVQTCFYGENKMRFLSLAPVGTAAGIR